jgi:hypothetical protein
VNVGICDSFIPSPRQFDNGKQEPSPLHLFAGVFLGSHNSLCEFDNGKQEPSPLHLFAGVPCRSPSFDRESAPCSASLLRTPSPAQAAKAQQSRTCISLCCSLPQQSFPTKPLDENVAFL